ncbi:MAG: M28 family peptidase [Catenulispora sp.]|nr:M28 family peptidase [Catenulispora sp.]
MKATVAALAARELAGRRVATPGGLAARAIVTAALTELDTVSETDPFKTPAGEAANVYAAIADATPGGRQIWLTAHYDGVGDRDAVHRPGASDNASGVAVVLEAARLLKHRLPGDVGLSVALLDAEEIGALGSAHHAARLAAEGRTPLIINVDGAGELNEAVSVEAGGDAMPILAALDSAGKTVGVPLRAGQIASDNRQYVAAGLAAVGVGAGMPGYHTEGDTAERVRPDTLTAMASLVVATVEHLATQHTNSSTQTFGAGTMSEPLNELPVMVIGAGPVGLAAAAHLAARNVDFLVLESGDAVGAAIRQWGHVRLFSPWRYNIDSAARALLEQSGWSAPDADVNPTGAELVERYLAPLAATEQIRARIRLGHKVTAISRVGVDRVRSRSREFAPFLIRVEVDGQLTDLHARAVIDATGTWNTPNVLGASGLPAYGEAEATAFIDHALPDVLGAARATYAGKHTLVVGAGYSAVNTMLSLAELAEQEPDTRVTWAIRTGSAARSYGGGDADALPARGALGTRLKDLVAAGRIELVNQFSTRQIRTLSDGTVEVESVDARDVKKIVTADRIVAATGFRPDHSIASELRLDLDPVLGATRELAPLIDPNEHSCGTVPPHGVDQLSHPEPGYFAIGAKSYGRAPTFLMATGYEQARSVVAALAGDWEAARAVQLDLPETGVCSTSLPGEEADSGGCGSSCGSAEPEAVAVTAEQDSGCCGTPVAEPVPVKVGLATGLSGGLLSEPLAIVSADGGSGCCG